MSDELMNTPRAEQETEVFGIDASTDGRRNSYTLSCAAIGQSMNYAACLWRQNVLSGKDIRTPADWAPCDAAGRAGNCKAMLMREEELIAGKSIYFRSRESVMKGLQTVRQWVMPTFGRKAPSATHAPAPKPAGGHLLDAVGTAPTYADAVERLAREAGAAPAPTPAPARVIPIASMVALPGESPLAMARRLRAQQQTNP